MRLATMAGRLSLRVRLMLLATAGVAVALAIGSVLLYLVLAITLNRTVDDAAYATAKEIRQLAAQGGLGDPLPAAGIQVVQVVDPQGRVLHASANADRLVPMLRGEELAATRGAAWTWLTVPGSRAAVAGPLRVCALRLDDGRVALVAAQVGELQQGQRLLGQLLLLTYPLLLGALALLSWWVIGRALRPVEALRAGAERISGSGRDERLPVPRQADELHALAETLNHMLDRLAAARGRQRAFVADAAHELRSPLASMRTQLEVAQRLGEAGDLPSDLLADVQRIERLVEDLLLLARSDADGPPPAARSSVDVRALLLDVASRYAAARAPVRVAPGSPVFAGVDPAELERAVANLVDNAVRHAASTVVLSVAVEGPAAVVAVEDDGPGIAAVDRERVFERFTRLDDARSRDAGGTGLGLPIVRELARRAGGSVRLTDRRSGESGLRAELRLPR